MGPYQNVIHSLTLSSTSRSTSSLVPLLATETLNLGHPKSLTGGPVAAADLQDCGRRDAVGVEVIIHRLFPFATAPKEAMSTMAAAGDCGGDKEASRKTTQTTGMQIPAG